MANLRITYIVKSAHNGGHEHITDCGNSINNWELSVLEIIRRIENKTDTFYVYDDKTGKYAYVAVIRPATGRPYVRTHADGYWNDNLLALPTCIRSVDLGR